MLLTPAAPYSVGRLAPSSPISAIGGMRWAGNSPRGHQPPMGGRAPRAPKGRAGPAGRRAVARGGGLSRGHGPLIVPSGSAGGASGHVREAGVEESLRRQRNLNSAMPSFYPVRAGQRHQRLVGAGSPPLRFPAICRAAPRGGRA